MAKVSEGLQKELDNMVDKIDDFMANIEMIADEGSPEAKKSLVAMFNKADKAYDHWIIAVKLFIKAQKKLNEGGSTFAGKLFAQIIREGGKIKWSEGDPGRRNVTPGTLLGTHEDIMDDISITPYEDGKRFELVVDGEYAGKFPSVKVAKAKAEKLVKESLEEMTSARRDAENQKALKRINDFWDRSKGDRAKFSAQINLRTKKMTKIEKLQIWASELENQNHHDEAEEAFKRLKALGG
jgi:hypothetical protein